MSSNLSSLLNTDVSGDQTMADQDQSENIAPQQQPSPTERRESIQSPELPKYNPPQRPRPSDAGVVPVQNGTLGSARRQSFASHDPSSEYATTGTIELPPPLERSHEQRKSSMTGLLPLQTSDSAHVARTLPASESFERVEIKQEAAASPQEYTPPSSARPHEDIHASKTLASLKHEHTSRTHSPLRESSLALPTTEDASPIMPPKKRPATAKKKGTATTAKKPKSAIKKRKPDALKVPKNGTRASSAASSPTPSEAAEEYDEDDSAADSDEDVEGSGDVYCICRKPDNGTFMIGCDGGCDDWFHGKCVSIEEKDKNLIDKYICPRCVKAGIGRTSWKKMCRRDGCRQPARVGKNAGKDGKVSKYCSDDCGMLFFRQMAAQTRGAEQARAGRRKGDAVKPDTGPAARGGILSAGEVRAMLDQTNSAEEFRDLGNGVLSPPATPSEDGMTELEKAAVEKIATEKNEARQRHGLLKDRQEFFKMVKNEATRIAAEKDLKPKEYCGYDSRLEWTEEEFSEWRQSPQGQKAFETDSLAADVEGASGVCTRKKCARHTDWNRIVYDDIRFEQAENSDRMRKLEHEEKDIRDRAATRAKARKYGLDEGTVEMHDVVMADAPVLTNGVQHIEPEPDSMDVEA